MMHYFGSVSNNTIHQFIVDMSDKRSIELLIEYDNK